MRRVYAVVICAILALYLAPPAGAYPLPPPDRPPAERVPPGLPDTGADLTALWLGALLLIVGAAAVYLSSFGLRGLILRTVRRPRDEERA